MQSVCTWNCSVRRAAVFFEKHHAHEEEVSRQARELEDLEKRIAAVRSQLEDAEVDSLDKDSPARFVSCSRRSHASSIDRSGLKDLTTADYDVADFYSCSDDNNSDAKSDA
eukprot:TRINITY_DN16936_c0_g1_i1.p1 TRINITY_DN16936_c0_g1~~TRINITY_DN16936_c0_g1_i1.p1  ORF type:complete len:111 (+),score=26.28 TRINITY_DN16936_c0_g1_i1:80-412(+)